jgi:hypothetical protein
MKFGEMMQFAIETRESQIWTKIADVRDINAGRRACHLTFLLQPAAADGGQHGQAEND